MANEDYKNGKLVEIIREFDNTGSHRYEINGINQSIAVPFWRIQNGKFNVIPLGSYKFITEAGNNYLEVLDETILSQATQFQIVYIYSQTSSKYIDDFPEVSVLATKYNELVEDATKLFSYLKSVGMTSDTLQLTKVLSQLEPLTTWYMDENEEIKTLPISELYSRFQLMVEELYKIIKNLLDNYYETLSSELKKTVLKYVSKLKAELDKHKEELDDYTQERIEEIKSICDRIIDLALNTLTKADTIEKLKLMRLKEGDVVEVLGYYEAGDGAGHKRVIRAEDDGSGVQVANGLWANIVHNGEVNVSWFGAKGDGVTDDSDIIQKALDYNTPIIVINKNFIITKMLTLKSNICILSKNGSIEVRNDIKIMKALHTDNNSNSNIMIDGLKFKGYCSFETNDESGLVAIEFLYTKNIIIKNCVFDGFNKNIEFTLCENCDVCNNIILNATETSQKINGYGVLLETCKNVTITKNIMDNIERHAIYINMCNGVNAYDNYIQGQTNDLERYSHYEGNIKINGSRNIQVSKNIIKGNYYGVGLLKSFSDDFGGDNIKIYDNTILNVINNPGFAMGGVIVLEEANYSNIEIKDNYITRDSLLEDNVRGIIIDYGTFSGLRIEGNKISNMSRGIRIIKTDPIILNNNICENCNVGYDLYFNGLQVKGEVMYYKDCVTPINSATNTLAKCKMKRIVNLSSDVEQITGSSVNANLGNSFFVGAESVTLIDAIVNGFNGQIIEIWAFGNGFLQIKKERLNSIVKITKDYVSGSTYGVIRFINRQGVWYELSRIEGVDVYSLDTPYYATKMQQEGVYEDFISYMDNKTAYDKEQRENEKQKQLAYEEALKKNSELTYEQFIESYPVTVPLVEEPKPSQALKDFMDKYL